MSSQSASPLTSVTVGFGAVDTSVDVVEVLVVCAMIGIAIHVSKRLRYVR
jgi:hypothetical protein